MILLVNACVRNGSRTKLLADYLLSKLNGNITEHRLSEIDFPVADENFLETRDALIDRGEYSDPIFRLARDFAEAETIVVAAPFWDLSFPAALKQYFEQINVLGITFVYTSEGIPAGLCKAKRLYYVTTAGGNYVPTEYGFGYVRDLAKNFYGITGIELIKATGLDINGANETEIIAECKKQIDALFEEQRLILY